VGVDLEQATLGAALAAAVTLPTGAWISVNVSPSLVLDGTVLADLLAGCAHRIVLELTAGEGTDDAALRAAFSRLGPDVLVAIADPGAGIVDHRRLDALRTDLVLLDRSLVRGIDADKPRQALVDGLRRYATSSSRTLIAVGVETNAERDALLHLEVQYGQGYLWGAPGPVDSWGHLEVDETNPGPAPEPVAASQPAPEPAAAPAIAAPAPARRWPLGKRLGG
jgi:EAL domain-containing protein (putative c-di-GMP-specific phosphodiesterase class I)